ncbi:MAG: hypothetical protein ACKO01_13915 [Erythrobacter sp.]
MTSFFVELFAEFLRFGIHQNDLTVEEVAIICVVGAESTRELRKNPFATRTYGGELAAIPNEERPSVSLKFIYTTLGMSRETTRRRVVGLVDRGYLRRSRRGIYFPAQVGESDYTAEMRAFLVRKLRDLDTYLEKIPD